MPLVKRTQRFALAYIWARQLRKLLTVSLFKRTVYEPAHRLLTLN